MNRTHPLLAAWMAAVLLGIAGCIASAPPPVATETRWVGVNRDNAVASARDDAHRRYGELVTGDVDVQRRGGCWIVELRRSNGGGLRYAISAQDGSIRERSTFQ